MLDVAIDKLFGFISLSYLLILLCFELRVEEAGAFTQRGKGNKRWSEKAINGGKEG